MLCGLTIAINQDTSLFRLLSTAIRTPGRFPKGVLMPLYIIITIVFVRSALLSGSHIISVPVCYQALKAIVCQRMGRQEEGNALINEVVKACPGDQATLQATTMYYRETGDGMFSLNTFCGYILHTQSCEKEREGGGVHFVKRLH